MNSVVIEEVALTARFLVQVASLASRHGQFTVRAAFFLLSALFSLQILTQTLCNPIAEPWRVAMPAASALH